MKKIFQTFTTKDWISWGITFVLVLFQVRFDLKVPEYMSEITELVQTDGSAMKDILIAGAYMLGSSLGGLLVMIIIGYFSAQIATSVAMRLREQVYKKTLTFSMLDMNTFSTGSLITRTTNDITQVQSFIAMGYIVAIRAPFMAVVALSEIFDKNITFSMVVVVALICLITAVSIVLKLTIPKSKKIQQMTDGLNTVVREHLIGLRVVRAYNAEKYHEDKFEIENAEVSNANIFVNRTTAFAGPFMTCLMSVLTLAIYFIGVSLINEASLPMDKLTVFSDMIVFSMYAMLIIMAFMMLTMNILMMPRFVVALNRISEVIDYENTVPDNSTSENTQKSDIAIEFKNVTFAYPKSEEAVVQDISFAVKKGETIAIIGSTGSGKSTIINLILRFFDCTKGEILVDGKNIKEYSQNNLRDKLGLVSQKAQLFNAKIWENIAYGEETYDEKQLERAIKIAQAKDFVDKVGVDSEVSQGGLNLSGGQKQRLSIARAIYKNSEIYLFDDCFSALDYKTDRVLRKTLEEETKEATKIMVAQRISTVKDADQIIVLDHGKISAIGKHKDLLENSSVYKEIAESQLSKEELENE